MGFKNHLICNHSYSHNYFHSQKISLENFEADFLKCDSLINTYQNYSKLFRYPYLKEGNTLEKRDGFREFLSAHGYKTGYVTIDASDWYIDGRMRDTLKINPNADLTPYKEYYLMHIYDRAMFYDSLAEKLQEGK
jgi:peptidoglycan/xylan/chitin deacetylase (PgdA/CDA1 family)